MKKSSISYILLAAAWMMGNSAWADGQHTFRLQSERADWATSSQSYDMETIASELGTDAATLFSQIEAWKNMNYAGDLFMLQYPDESWNGNHGSAGDGAFYIDQNGGFLDGWGDAAGYTRLDYDEQTITITMGQTGKVTSGDIKSCVSINLNGQTVVFDCTLSIIIPEIDKIPTTTIADLEVVGQKTYTLTQVPNNDWYNEPNTVDLKGICELLDIEPAYMAEKIRPMLFAKHFNSSNEAWDEYLVNDFTATPAPGFWFNNGVWDEVEQKESDELTQGAWLGNTGNKFWVASIAFDNEQEALNCTIGHYPGAWALGENHTADIYLVYGNKAYVITFDLTIDIALDNTIDNYTKVGESTITLNRDPRNGWSVMDSNAIDMAGVVAAFDGDATADDITLWAPDQYGNLTDAYTADAPGFWFSTDGSVIAYTGGTQSFFVNMVTDSISGEKSFDIGNMPNVFNGGETCSASLYLIAGKKYYEYKVNMTIDAPSFTLETCEVEEKNLVVKLVPSTGWEVGKTDVTAIEELIGTNSGVFYGVNSNNEITTAYSVTEATTYGGGGFWMSPADADGMAYAAGYSGDGAYAIWYYDGNITWFNVPGLPQPGDVRYGTFYLANLWDGKAVKLNVTIKWVDEITTVDVVGEEEITLAGRSADGSYVVTPADIAKCAEALECPIEDFALKVEWYGYDSNEDLTTDLSLSEFGYLFDADGLGTDDEAKMKFAVGFFDDEFRAYILNDEDLNKEFNTTLYASYEGKNYAFHITVKADVTTGIATVKSVSDSKCYDLSGRAVVGNIKGIIIRDGKKYLNK